MELNTRVPAIRISTVSRELGRSPGPDVQAVLGSSVAAAQLQTPLERAIWLESAMSRREAIRVLEHYDLDQAPVRYGSGALGYALLTDLRTSRSRRVRTMTRGFEPAVLVAANASVSTVLRVLNFGRFAFVLGDQEVSGFITPSDLGKHPARTHFYVLVSTLEVQLAALIRRRYGAGEDTLALLAESRRKAVVKRHGEEQQEGIDSDWVANLNFADILRIVAQTPAIREQLASSGTEWTRRTGRLDRLRNYVMHPSKEFQRAYRDLAALLTMDEDMRLLVGRAEISQRPEREARRT